MTLPPDERPYHEFIRSISPDWSKRPIAGWLLFGVVVLMGASPLIAVALLLDWLL